MESYLNIHDLVRKAENTFHNDVCEFPKSHPLVIKDILLDEFYKELKEEFDGKYSKESE